jgi:predicted nuclease with TOPRIM domain
VSEITIMICTITSMGAATIIFVYRVFNKISLEHALLRADLESFQKLFSSKMNANLEMFNEKFMVQDHRMENHITMMGHFQNAMHEDAKERHGMKIEIATLNEKLSYIKTEIGDLSMYWKGRK